MDMDMIKEYLRYMDPHDALQFVSSNKYLYNYVNIFKYLMHIHYPQIPDFGHPKEQYIALTNDQSHTFYIKVMATDSETCPYMIYKHLFKHNQVSDDTDTEFIQEVKIQGLKPPTGTIMYIGIWMDFAYGENYSYAYTVADIVNAVLYYYNIHFDEEDASDEYSDYSSDDEFVKYEIDKKKQRKYMHSDALRKTIIQTLNNDGQYCYQLEVYPYGDEPALSPPVLTIRRVTVV